MLLCCRYDFVDDDGSAEDCDGHGTLVASIAIGRTVGLAKQAHVVSVRVLDCHGHGSISRTVAGKDLPHLFFKCLNETRTRLW